MRRERGPDRRRPAGEGADVEVGAHPRPIVDRIVVPEDGLAPDLLGDAIEMARAVFARADLLAGPEHLDRRIEARAQRFEIAGRAHAEAAVELDIVAVVGRAEDDA